MNVRSLRRRAVAFQIMWGTGRRIKRNREHIRWSLSYRIGHMRCFSRKVLRVLSWYFAKETRLRCTGDTSESVKTMSLILSDSKLSTFLFQNRDTGNIDEVFPVVSILIMIGQSLTGATAASDETQCRSGRMIRIQKRQKLSKMIICTLLNGSTWSKAKSTWGGTKLPLITSSELNTEWEKKK